MALYTDFVKQQMSTRPEQPRTLESAPPSWGGEVGQPPLFREEL